MNKKDLVRVVSEKTGATQKAIAPIMDAMLDTIVDNVLSGEKVALMNFGNFELRSRSARTVINPRTHEPMEIGETKNIHFIPSTCVRERANND